MRENHYDQYGVHMSIRSSPYNAENRVWVVVELEVAAPVTSPTTMDTEGENTETEHGDPEPIVLRYINKYTCRAIS